VVKFWRAQRVVAESRVHFLFHFESNGTIRGRREWRWLGVDSGDDCSIAAREMMVRAFWMVAGQVPSGVVLRSDPPPQLHHARAKRLGEGRAFATGAQWPSPASQRRRAGESYAGRDFSRGR